MTRSSIVASFIFMALSLAYMQTWLDMISRSLPQLPRRRHGRARPGLMDRACAVPRDGRVTYAMASIARASQ